MNSKFFFPPLKLLALFGERFLFGNQRGIPSFNGIFKVFGRIFLKKLSFLIEVLEFLFQFAFAAGKIVFAALNTFFFIFLKGLAVFFQAFEAAFGDITFHGVAV